MRKIRIVSRFYILKLVLPNSLVTYYCSRNILFGLMGTPVLYLLIKLVLFLLIGFVVYKRTSKDNWTYYFNLGLTPLKLLGSVFVLDSVLFILVIVIQILLI